MDKELLEAIGSILEKRLEPLNIQMNQLAFHMDSEFAQIRDRMDKMDARMDGMESHMGQMDERLNHMAASMKLMDSRMDRMEGRLDQMDRRMDRMEDDIAVLREDSDITRAAANELLEWSGVMSQAVGFPLPKVGDKIP